MLNMFLICFFFLILTKCVILCTVYTHWYFFLHCASVVSLAEIITNVDEVDLTMFNSISKSNTKSNKNNLDVVQLAASVIVICIQ